MTMSSRRIEIWLYLWPYNFNSTIGIFVGVLPQLREHNCKRCELAGIAVLSISVDRHGSTGSINSKTMRQRIDLVTMY